MRYIVILLICFFQQVINNAIESTEKLQFYFACNEDMKPFHNDTFNFVNMEENSTNFILDSNNCTALDLQEKLIIEAILVSDQNQCAIQNLVLDTENCDKSYSIEIKNIQLENDDEGNITQIIDRQINILHPQQLEEGDNGILNINIKMKTNLVIENILVLYYKGQGIQLQEFQEIYFINSGFLNRESYDNRIFILQNGQKFVIQNGQFLNFTQQSQSSLMYLDGIREVQIQGSKFLYGYSSDQGTALNIRNSEKLEILQSEFQGLTSLDVGGAVYIKNIDDFQAIDSNFTACLSYLFAGAIEIDSGDKALVQNCKFIQNVSQRYASSLQINGGNKNFTVQDSLFLNNQAKEGGAIYISNCIMAKIFKNTFQNNTSVLNGGAILQGLNPGVEILNNTFLDNFSQKGKGGAIALENFWNGDVGYSISVQKNLFQGNKAKQGGGVSIQSIQLLEFGSIFQNEFIGNIAIQGGAGGVYLNGLNHQLVIKNNTFTGNVAQTAGGGLQGTNIENTVIIDCLFEDNQSNSQAGGIDVKNGGNLLFENVQFLKNQAQSSTAGLLIFASNSGILKGLTFFNNTCQGSIGALGINKSQNFTVEDSDIIENTSIAGSGIRVQSSQGIVLQRNLVEKNLAFNFGAGIYIYQSDGVKIEACQFLNNVADLNSAGIFIQLSNNTQIIDTQVQENLAKNSKGGIAILAGQQIRLQNCTVKNNTGMDSSGGVYIFMSSDLEIFQLQMEENTNQGKQGGGMTIIQSDRVTIEESVFQNNHAYDQGGGLHIQQCNVVKATNVEIQSNIADMSGGGAFIIESTEVNLNQVNIVNNQAENDAGGILISQCTDFLYENSTVHKNMAINGQAGGIFIKQECDQIQFQELQISENKANLKGGGASLDFSKNIRFSKINFLQNEAQEKGSGIHADQIDSIQVEDSMVEKHEGSDYGGSFCLHQIKKLDIINTVFQENQAIIQGGAIYGEQIDEIIIQDGIFDQNKVAMDDKDNKGGTIYLNKGQNMALSNTTINNSEAFMYGGGLYLLSLENFSSQNSVLENCNLQYDLQLLQSDKDQDYVLSQGGAIYYEPRDQEESTSFSLQNTSVVNCKASSGGAVLVNFMLNGQKISISVQDSLFKNNKGDLGPAIRFLGVKDQEQINEIQNNLVNASNVENIAQFKYLNGSEGSDYYFGYYYNEKILDDVHSQFELCIKGQYLERGGENECIRCLKNGNCKGGYKQVTPKKEYWRDSPQSYKFEHCHNNPSACLGEDNCREGHLGLLCERCDRVNDYSMDTSTQVCQKCEKNKVIIISQLVFIFILVVVFLFNQIYGVTTKINKSLIYKGLNVLFDIPIMRVKQLSASTKIVIMHFQVLYIVVGSQFKQLQKFINNFQVIGSPQTGFSRNLECIIIQDEGKDVKEVGYYMSLYGIVILGGTAVFLIILEVLCYACKKYIRQGSQLTEYVQGTILVFFLFIQPSMVLNAFEYLKVRTVNGVDYCFSNTSILIDSDYFRTNVLPLNIVVVVLLGVVFPIILTVFMVMGKRNNRLQSISFQRKCGILYLEYKDKNYYWELIIIIVKIAIVVIANQLENYKEVKGIFAVFLLVAYMFLCFRIWPYKTQQLNYQALYSFLVLILTIGMLTNLENSEISQIFKDILLILILIFNVSFILYSSYIMSGDFIQTIRIKLIQHCQFSKIIQKRLLNRCTKEQNALLRWKCVKKTFHYSVKLYSKEKDKDNGLSFEDILLENYARFNKKIKKKDLLFTDSNVIEQEFNNDSIDMRQFQSNRSMMSNSNMNNNSNMQNSQNNAMDSRNNIVIGDINLQINNSGNSTQLLDPSFIHQQNKSKSQFEKNSHVSILDQQSSQNPLNIHANNVINIPLSDMSRYTERNIHLQEQSFQSDLDHNNLLSQRESPIKNQQLDLPQGSTNRENNMKTGRGRFYSMSEITKEGGKKKKSSRNSQNSPMQKSYTKSNKQGSNSVLQRMDKYNYSDKSINASQLFSNTLKQDSELFGQSPILPLQQQQYQQKSQRNKRSNFSEFIEPEFLAPNHLLDELSVNNNSNLNISGAQQQQLQNSNLGGEALVQKSGLLVCPSNQGDENDSIEFQ